MLGWLRKIAAGPSGIGQMTRDLERMIQEGRHMYDAAANALLAGTEPEAIREDLFATDRRVNRLEQKIRRAILVHGSVHGSADLPEQMVLMSVAKDAERIGDYGKNLFELAVLRPIGSDDPFHADLSSVKEQTSRLLAEAPDVYSGQDEGAAKEFIDQAWRLMRHCEEKMSEILRAEGCAATGAAPCPGHEAASVLAYRFHKRIIGHTQNIVSAVVMPVDKLHYLDEPEKTGADSRPPGDG